MVYPVKISLISYTNTKPFVFGIQHSKELENKILTSFDSPAECARKLTNKECDLGIVPVAALGKIEEKYILSRYCIGADGEVNSVYLFSKVSLPNIRTISLDPESRTSNNLTRVLCEYFWKIHPSFVGGNKEGYSFQDPTNALVLIGDRTFAARKLYPYQYDLAGEWKRFTGLPFVFALWAFSSMPSPEFESLFNSALEMGLNNREEVLRLIERDPLHEPEFDYSDYLWNKLQFEFDKPKKEALQVFLDFLKKLDREHSFI